MVGSRLYVGNLPKIANERDLERFFKGFGRVREVLIKTGYGFVELDDPRDAEDALYELNGKRLLGERVTVERARGTPRGRDQWAGHRDNRQYYNRNNYHNNYHNNHHNNHYNNHHNNHNGNSNNNDRFGPPTRTDHRLIVENLSSRCSWQDLKDYMRQAGEVTYADAHKYKNEGVVEFASYSEMKNALEKLDDTDLNGRRIHLIEDKPKRGRKSLSYSSRSRSRSRSQRKSATPSPSRSRSGSKLLARNPSNPSKSPLKAYTNGNRSQSPPAPMRKSIVKSKSRSRSNSVKSNQSTDLSSKSRSLSPTTD